MDRWRRSQRVRALGPSRRTDPLGGGRAGLLRVLPVRDHRRQTGHRVGGASTGGCPTDRRVDFRRRGMSAKKDSATVVGLGVAACAACCAGPILAVLAAIGLGTVAGFVLFGTIAIVIGAAIAAFVVILRRRREQACSSSESSGPVPVELTTTRSPS